MKDGRKAYTTMPQALKPPFVLSGDEISGDGAAGIETSSQIPRQQPGAIGCKLQR